jgi:CRP-like cAMP-binding protein
MNEALKQCQLFANLAENEQEECLKIFNFQVKKYKKGDQIVFAHEEVIQQLILIKGAVKNEMTDFNGKSIKIADMTAPKILAPGFLFGIQSQYPVNIIAEENTEIMAINKVQFLEALRYSSQLQLNFLNVISNQTQFLTRKINFLSFKTIKGKIAHFLLTLKERQKTDNLILPQNIGQLAELFGVARPSLSRALSQMQQEEIINMDAKNVEILDISKLKAYLQ